MKRRYELRALMEEVLTGLFLVAGFLASLAGSTGWSKALWAYAAWNFLCANYFWMKNKLHHAAEEAADE